MILITIMTKVSKTNYGQRPITAVSQFTKQKESDFLLRIKVVS